MATSAKKKKDSHPEEVQKMYGRRDLLKGIALAGLGAGVAGLLSGMKISEAAVDTTKPAIVSQFSQIGNASVVVFQDKNGNSYVVDKGVGPQLGELIVKANVITPYGAGLGAGTAGAQTQTGGILEALNTSAKSILVKYGNYPILSDIIINKPGIALIFEPGTTLTFSNISVGGIRYEPQPSSGPFYLYGFPVLIGNTPNGIALRVVNGYSANVAPVGRSVIQANIRGTWLVGASIEGVTYQSIFCLDVLITGPPNSEVDGIKLVSYGGYSPNANLFIKPVLDVKAGAGGTSIGFNIINGSGNEIVGFDGAYESGIAIKIADVQNIFFSPRFEANSTDISFVSGANNNELIYPTFASGPSAISDTSTGTNRVVMRVATGSASGFGTATPAMPASGTAQANNNSYPVIVYLYGGTVTQITINGQVVFSSGTGISLTGQSFILNPKDTIAITYTAAPTWKWYGL